MFILHFVLNHVKIGDIIKRPKAMNVYDVVYQ